MSVLAAMHGYAAMGLCSCALTLAACAGAPVEPVVTPRALPVAHKHGHRFEVVGDRLYLVGGYERGSGERGPQTAWVWDLRQGGWTALPDMQVERGFCGSATYAGSVLAIGDGVEQYDAQRGAWSQLVGPGILPVSHFGAAVAGRVLYVVGGFPAPEGGVAAFDLASRQPMAMPPLPGFEKGDHFHLAVELRGALHVLGGLANASFSPTVPHWRWDGSAWQRLHDLPIPLWTKFAAAQKVGDELFVFATDARSGLCYSAVTAQWRTCAPLPAVLAVPASHAADGRIHVLGGMVVPGADAGVGGAETAADGNRQHWVYDPATDRWQ